jgi:transposase
MPFEETDRVKEREELIRMWRSGEYAKSELARRFGVSRPTVDLWITRDACNEPLCDRSRAPRHCPHRTEQRIVEHVLAVRREHPHWGPKKIVAVLERREPAIEWPAPSTIGDWLSTRGLTSPRVRRNPKNQPSSCNQQLATRAGQMTTADFKGQFRLQKRSVLLSADHRRSTQPLPLRDRSLGSTTRGVGATGIRTRFSRVRPARNDPHRQRATIRRLTRTDAAIPTLSVVAKTRREHPSQPSWSSRRQRHS